MMNSKQDQAAASRAATHPSRQLARWSLGGLVVVATLGLGLLVGSGGRAPAPTAQLAVPATEATEVPAREVEPIVPTVQSDPTAAPVPTSAPDIALAPAELYMPTGADTELSGLAAAEAGRMGKPTLVWFHAHWCHVCQEIRPEMEAIGQAYSPRLAMVTMNVDHVDSQDAAQRYQVSGTPTFVLFGADGEVVKRFSGWLGRPTLESFLDRVTAAN